VDSKRLFCLRLLQLAPCGMLTDVGMCVSTLEGSLAGELAQKAGCADRVAGLGSNSSIVSAI
jgi:hypothetical protein